MVADNQGFSRRRQQQQEETRRRHGDGGAVSRRGGTRNQNNASVENRGAATDIDEPMEVDRSKWAVIGGGGFVVVIVVVVGFVVVAFVRVFGWFQYLLDIASMKNVYPRISSSSAM